ncbi:AMP-binding protein [Gordonia sp. TBRC 11910]|uniref:AMP-binding protein n=1 Tax=Gordonia asplenii TaxID=2725283 RepID=A0A848KSH2_9ACTN|nr:AMP-binding protein [Gordonia asplenii]NMO01212.1 AMP-binding protein [Gordonia asplenii]
MSASSHLDAVPTTAALILARRDDDSTALLVDERSWTWREFVDECAVRAAALVALRRPGPWHVGVLMDNDPEYLFLIGGAALCGATIVGVNPTRRGAELAGDVVRTDCGLVIVGDSYRDLVPDIEDVVDVAPTSGGIYRDAVAAARGARVDDWADRADAQHNLLLLFTSGSTGTPKAVLCGTSRLAAIGMLNIHGLTSDDVAYNAMPLFHGNALMSAWAPVLSVGATYAMRAKFSASGFLPDIQRFRATFFNYVGRSLAYILAQPESAAEADNCLRFGWGTEASARDRAEFTRRFATRITESYGSSEGVCVIVRDETTPSGALGKPNPMLGMQVVAPDGTPCPPARFTADGAIANPTEAIGEIVARGGAARFEGYYDNPDATAEKIRDGDYWSGDLAYVDADGVFWFAGRTNDWIRVDSENFSTAPLERIIARYPAIRGVAAYAVPDPRTGDRVMITVELASDPSGDDAFDPADFADFLAAQPDMGTKWTPALIRLTDRFPLTATRKLDKATLRHDAWFTADRVVELRDGAYHELDDARRAEIVEQFSSHGRAHLLHSRKSSEYPPGEGISPQVSGLSDDFHPHPRPQPGRTDR